MSTHSVDVVQLGKIEPHPNADKLEMVKVGEYVCLIPKGQFKEGDLAAYIEPDYVVPDRPEYSFLAGRHRIGAKRLRGVWSEGLLVRAPEGAKVGDNVMEQLGITRWEPPSEGYRPRAFSGPPLGCLESVPDFIRGVPKYDLENLKKYRHLFQDGELVFVTEKLHGTNARYVFHDGRMYCGSRTQWRKEEPANVYWSALAQNKWVEGWCRLHPDTVLYGEIFGDVQDMKYGMSPGQYEFRAFDRWDGKRFLDVYNIANMWTAPLIGDGALHFDFERLKELAEEDSHFGGIREGLVIEPVLPRYDPRVGRVKMKLVSNRYLSRA